MTVKDI